MKSLLPLVLVGALFAGAGSGTVLEARALAQSAAALIETEGFERARAHVLDPAGRYRDRDLYVYVLDRNGVILAHPDLALIGADASETRDLEGRPFIREVLERARHERGGFWVSYVWPHPFTARAMLKQAWIEVAGDYVVGCGAYLPLARAA